jgi:translation initiation factor 1
MSNHRLVYSTDDGDQRRAKQRPPSSTSRGPALPKDGVVRVFREKAGRGGKTVTIVRGLGGDLTAAATDLKRHCGTGGSVKGDAVEIQGDHREKVAARLRAAGHAVKLAGG